MQLKNRIRVLILFSATIFLSCQTQKIEPVGGPVMGPTTTSQELFLAGYVGQDPLIKPAYWNEGSTTILSEKNGAAFTVGLSNRTKVYTLGYLNANIPRASVWQNGEQSLIDGTGNDIAVDADDVYVAGGFGDHAAFWKNGNRTILPSTPGITAQALRIIVKNGSVHIGINVLNNDLFSHTTIYWKDGTLKVLSSRAGFSDMTISDPDVYILGFQSDATDKSIIWKNGAAFCSFGGKVSSAGKTLQYHASGLCTVGGYIYVTGVQNDFQTQSPCYWKINLSNKETNGPILLSYGSSNKYMFKTSIGAVGEDVYISGYDDVLHKSFLWKNGILIAPFDESSNSVNFCISRICVVNY